MIHRLLRVESRLETDLTREQAKHLLRYGLNETRRAVDELLDLALEKVDPSPWLEGLIERALSACAPIDPHDLATGLLEAPQLQRLTTRARQLYQDSEATEDRVAGLLIYLLCLATRTSRNGGQELEPELDSTLRDLAAVLPPPWHRLCERALTSAEDEEGGRGRDI